MRLWRFVIAKGITWHDATDEVQALLDRVTVEDLRDPSFWPSLTTLVRIAPDDDVLPVRAPYDPPERTIGLNHLQAEEPLWYTLADCITSTLLSGKPPRIVEALRFEPEGMQEGLQPIAILGNPEYRIDPYMDDLYQRLIELRRDLKRRLQAAKEAGDDALAARLDAEQ
jgi:hypothetical protein